MNKMLKTLGLAVAVALLASIGFAASTNSYTNVNGVVFTVVTDDYGVSTISSTDPNQAPANADNAARSAIFDDITVYDDAEVKDDLTVGGAATVGETLGVTGVATFTAESVHNGGIDADYLTTDAAAGVDTKAAGTLLLGAATATKVEVGDTGVETEIQGTLDVHEAAAFTVAPTMPEATVDGKYAVVGGDATTGLMLQKAAVTAGTGAVETNSFAVAFGAAPIVTCTYTEDPGDVRPIYVTLVTPSNFVANITADKNYGYTAVGSRP